MTKLSKQPSKCAGWGVTPTHHLLAYRAWADSQQKYVFGEGLTESLATQLPSSFSYKPQFAVRCLGKNWGFRLWGNSIAREVVIQDE
jgi:hypothetical protein